MEVAENFTLQWFDEEHFFLDYLYYALLNGCYVAIMNCGKVICGPFLFI